MGAALLRGRGHDSNRIPQEDSAWRSSPTSEKRDHRPNRMSTPSLLRAGAVATCQQGLTVGEDDLTGGARRWWILGSLARTGRDHAAREAAPGRGVRLKRRSVWYRRGQAAVAAAASNRAKIALEPSGARALVGAGNQSAVAWCLVCVELRPGDITWRPSTLRRA